MALQCDITQRLTKSSVPSKANTTNIIIKSEPKPPLIDEKPKEKKEEAPEISLETNEKMIIDDDVSENPVIKEEGYVFLLFRPFYFSFDNSTVAYYQLGRGFALIVKEILFSTKIPRNYSPYCGPSPYIRKGHSLEY